MVTMAMILPKNRLFSGNENHIGKMQKIIAIYYHIPAKIAIFYHLRGIGFFGQDEPNWIFLSSKITSYAFFERKKLLSKVP